MILEDAWREEGGLMDKGPFAAPVTFVRAQELKRDETSGETLLRLVPVHADKVHYEIGGPATTGSALVPDFQKFTTTDLRLSFLAVDSTDQHQTGPAIAWQNRISLKSRFSQQGCQRMCELLAAPPAPIFDTTKESYEFLAKLEKSGAEILGPRVMVGSSPWAEFTMDASTSLDRAALEKILHPLREIVGAGEVQLSCDGLSFSSGQDLLDWVSDHRTELKEHEVSQVVTRNERED